ncbi:class I SAM-dependent methyltransferase [Nostoc ellipsosporum NOK]|nr:class I SAM-dependent methyltransferase [Nostoc ellipsosporum NOK]
MQDILGQAIAGYQAGRRRTRLWILPSYGPRESMPVRIYFRTPAAMSELEHIALGACTGHILDAGAGAGSHALYLQQQDRKVTALDVSPLNCAVMKERGVKDVRQGDLLKWKGRRFDTVLLLMNGIGITGSIKGLKDFLATAPNLLKPGGQLLFDSSDVAYLYQDDRRKGRRYYGEVDYRYMYRGQVSEQFSWLYIDSKRLQALARAAGWRCDELYREETGQYLVRLTR